VEELAKTFERYGRWWTFKPNSTLRAYFQANNILINLHFTPHDLVDKIARIVPPTTHSSDVLTLIKRIQQRCCNQENDWMSTLGLLCQDQIEKSELSFELMIKHIRVKLLRLRFS
jgi:hypothetical protein